MVGVLQRHKIIFIIVSALLLAALLWLVVLKQGGNKVPMRGVFVVEQALSQAYDRL